MSSILALNHKFFMLPKVDARPKGFSFRFFCLVFFGTMQFFFENFRKTLAFFEVFGL